MLLFMSSLHLHAQDTCAAVKAETVKTYYKSKKLKSNDTFYYSKKVFTLSLNGAFKDSLKIYIGDKLIYDDYLVTDGSAGHSRHNIQVPFQNADDRPVLKIVFPNKNTCLSEKLNLRFPILEVRIANRLYLTYTNNFASLE
jgi:hypothetical protein